MPFCPKCRYEYNDDVFKCPDCDEWLVRALPEEDKKPDEGDDYSQYKDWIRLVRLTSMQYAEMVVDVLRSKNIPAVIQSGTGHFGITGQLGTDSFRPIGGGYSIMVPIEFAHKADQEGESILGEIWIKSRIFNPDIPDPSSDN